MRAVNQLPRILFFINGMAPTPSQVEEAQKIKNAHVVFRNGLLVDNTGASALEECDGVMGDVPSRYAAVYGETSKGSSGIGALRVVHEGERGVTGNQALHLDSTSTGDPIEEEKRRAHRGLPINETGARPSADLTLTSRTVPDGTPEGSVSNQGDPIDRPSGMAGAAQLSTAAVAQATGNELTQGDGKVPAEGAPAPGEWATGADATAKPASKTKAK